MLVIDTPDRLRTEVFGRKVVFHLENPDPRLADVISQMPYVHDANFIDSKLVAGVDDPEANNPDLIRFLIGQGANIQFVGELRRSLEDVYLELVRNK